MRMGIFSGVNLKLTEVKGNLSLVSLGFGLGMEMGEGVICSDRT